MQSLSQHVRRHQRQSAVGNPETRRAISVCVVANYSTVLDYCASIDDGTLDRAIPSYVHVGKYDRIRHLAIGTDLAIRKDKGVFHLGA